MRTLLLIIFILPISVFAEEKTVYDCNSSKEYITTNNFLKTQKHLELPASEIDKISFEVSKGCKNAAKRFIESFLVLAKSEAGSSVAAQYGVMLANNTDAYHEVFIDIFTSSFSKDHLDLDISTSIELAKNLSVDFKGDIKTVRQDFTDLTKFCLNEKLGLSLAQCAKLAQNLILQSEKYKMPVADSFIESYNYLTTNSKITMDKQTALRQAKELISLSPNAFNNFKTAFEFRQKSHSFEESLSFANQMARHTVYTTDKRLPASK